MSNTNMKFLARAISQLVLGIFVGSIAFGRQQYLVNQAKDCNIKVEMTPGKDLGDEMRNAFDQIRVERDRGDRRRGGSACKELHVEKRVGFLYKTILWQAVIMFVLSILTTFVLELITNPDTKLNTKMLKSIINASWLLTVFIVFSLVGIKSYTSVVGFTIVLGIIASASDALINVVGN